MYKLLTELGNYRFNSTRNLGPITVTWFKLEESEDETIGICLSKEELDQLIRFVADNKVNFINPNYFSCNNEDTPLCSVYDLIPIRARHPLNLIIRNIARVENLHGEIYKCMDIELLDSNGNPNHHYNLDFDIIGQININ